MSIVVRSHVGRDLLQNGAYFNSAPKVILEYVSNSIDNAPEGQSVTVDVTIESTEVTISDNASGMSQEDLLHFFTMHGVNRQRKRGRKVRGRFGTGKSAAFGIADGLHVETIRDGKRNVVELHRNRILSVPDGGTIPVDHLAKDEPTDRPNGTTVTIYELHLERIFVTPVRERLERALGRHLDMHEVIINNRRLKYRRPEAVETFTFEPPEEIMAQMPNTSPLTVSVAREALTSMENGVAILANGFLNAMTLGEASGRAYVERIFGEVEIPDLDDERDDEHFPAFDNTRDLSLNPQNPRAALVSEWISGCVEEVRKELDLQAQLDRLSEINSHMEDAANNVSDLINADFARVQRRLRVATQSAIEATTIGSSDVVEISLERSSRSGHGGQDQTDDTPAMEPALEEVEPDYPPINYDEPDHPDAQPVEFEEPPVPELQVEAEPDEAYETFVEYMAELDHLEEQAYREAVIEEAVHIPEAERREILHAALKSTAAAVDDEDVMDEEEVRDRNDDEERGFVARVESYGAPTDGNGSHDVHYQHVESSHQVLLAKNADQLQAVSSDDSEGTYEERWVVDRDSFVAGGTGPLQSESGQNGSSTEKPVSKVKKPRRRTYFHINFEHMGEDAPRSRFAEESRIIYINRDHPQLIHTEAEDGVESLAYRNLLGEIVIQEYASAVVRQMATTGFYVADPFDAVETIQAVVNRLAREAGQRMLSQDEEPAVPEVEG